MSNNSYVTSRTQKFDLSKLTEDLQEIVSRRNLPVGVILLKSEGFVALAWKESWGSEHNIKVEITSPKKLLITRSRSEHGYWFLSVIENELALKYNGLISDDGVAEKWKGEPNKYPTFKDYVTAYCERHENLINEILEENLPPTPIFSF